MSLENFVLFSFSFYLSFSHHFSEERNYRENSTFLRKSPSPLRGTKKTARSTARGQTEAKARFRFDEIPAVGRDFVYYHDLDGLVLLIW